MTKRSAEARRMPHSRGAGVAQRAVRRRRQSPPAAFGPGVTRCEAGLAARTRAARPVVGMTHRGDCATGRTKPRRAAQHSLPCDALASTSRMTLRMICPPASTGATPSTTHAARRWLNMPPRGATWPSESEHPSQAEPLVLTVVSAEAEGLRRVYRIRQLALRKVTQNESEHFAQRRGRLSMDDADSAAALSPSRREFGEAHMMSISACTGVL